MDTKKTKTGIVKSRAGHYRAWLRLPNGCGTRTLGTGVLNAQAVLKSYHEGVDAGVEPYDAFRAACLKWGV